MFKDSMISYNSKDEIHSNFKLLNNSNYGATSNIYIYNEKELLKVFNYDATIDDLIELEELKNIKTTTLVKPNKYLNINDEFSGYTMNKINGRMLYYINRVEIRKLLISLLKVEKDLVILAKNGFVACDLNPGNLIYNNKEVETRLIDCESYQKTTLESKEQNIIINMSELYNLVLGIISNTCGINKNEYYKYMSNTILNRYDFNLSNIYEFFNYFIDELENYVDKPIETVNDFKKCLRLVNE